MKRKEFAKKWGYERTMNTMGLPVTIPKYDEFLADLDSLSLPPAEDAEEIPDTKKFLSDNGYGSGTNYTTNQVAYLIREFATLHAQRLAGKMVEERLREELMAYDKFLSNTYWGVSHIVKRDEAVRLYLKSRER